jgi:hypothetical protein
MVLARARSPVSESDAELFIGEGLTAFYSDKVAAALGLAELIQANSRLKRVMLQMRFGRRRGRRIAAKARKSRRRLTK